MQQEPPARVYHSRRHKRTQRQKWVALAVMAGAVVVLFITALIIGLVRGGQTPPVVSTPPESTPPPAPPVVSSVAQASSVPPLPPRTPTPWDEDGIPALYNRFNSIPDTWQPDLTPAGGLQMDRRAAEAYTAMAEAAAEDGIALVACSGYRTNWEQTNNYNNAIQRYLSQGYSQEEALRQTELYYAIPGTSEHEAGLAMDVNDANYPGARIDDSFADTPAYTWLQENMTRFGFICRYQKDTTDITRIAWEPWHYRYVGANHAEKIVELDVTLEEYVDALCRAEGLTPPESDRIFGRDNLNADAGGDDTASSADTTGAQVPPSLR